MCFWQRMLDALSDVESCVTHDGSDAAAVPPYGHVECLNAGHTPTYSPTSPATEEEADPNAEADSPVMECPVAPDLLADAALSHLGLQQISYSSRHHLEIKLRRTQQKQEKLVDRAQKQLAAIYEVWSR